MLSLKIVFRPQECQPYPSRVEETYQRQTEPAEAGCVVVYSS